MDAKILDDYSSSIKLTENYIKWVSHKLSSYKYTRVKVQGTSIDIVFTESPGASSGSSQDFINSIQFNQQRIERIRQYLLSEIEDEIKEQKELAEFEFKKNLLSNI